MPDPSQSTGPRIGHFQVVSELGRGGMGVVYKAQDLSLHRLVALKVLPKHLAHDAAFVKRFLREARAGARLVHPNIAAVHAVGEQDGTYYIAMEYVKGENLSQHIKRVGQLSVPYALDIVRQSASALAEAHRAGIVHRDVKPHNIMVDQAGRVRVMDFGLARLLQADSKLTAEGAQVGTPRYMSPEQCRGGEVDTRSDIFSLGVVFYELLAGRAPHTADSPLALMYQIVQEKPPNIRDFNDDVPPSVVKLIERMTEKDPEKRIPSIDALLKEIDTLDLRTGSSPLHQLKERIAKTDLRAPAGRLKISRRTLAITAGIIALATFAGSGSRMFRRTANNPTASETAQSAAVTPPPPARTITFPSERSVGQLQIQDWGIMEPFAPFSDARGTVDIPEGKAINLIVNTSTVRDLSFLDDLDPNDLQGIRVREMRLNNEELRRVGRLTGLYFLVLIGDQISDDQLLHLSSLEKMLVLYLENNQITGEGLAHLKSMTALQTIGLFNTRMTDAGAKHLTAFRRLDNLNLHTTKITDKTMSQLKTLPNLAHLSLADTAVGLPGFRQLGHFPALNSLNLDPSQITGETVRLFQGLPNVSQLDISGSAPITPETVRLLGDWPQLEQLGLWHVTVGDAMVDALSTLTSLDRLLFIRTDVPEPILRSLQSALPNCELSDNDGIHR